MAHLELENFLIRVWGGGGGVGVSDVRPPPTTPKLNSTFLDLEKWLFMPEICDDILLLPVGNYSFYMYQIEFEDLQYIKKLGNCRYVNNCCEETKLMLILKCFKN